MIEAYKFRLYPNEEQKVLLNKHFGSVRFVYNWALDYNTEQYAQTKKHLGWMSIVTSGEFKQLKLDNEWLYEVASTTLQNTVGHLDKAFQRFFRHQGGFPRYKSKHDYNQSFEVPKGLDIDFKSKKIQIPKFLKQKNKDNRIKFVLTRRVKEGKIGTATVSKNPSGEYYISFIVHTNESTPVFDKEITKENSLGMDFGLKHFLTFSDGTKIDSPEYFKQALSKLRKQQRKLSKKQKGSNNKNKQRLKVAKVHQHIKNQRSDFLHKLSTKLIKDSQFDVFCIEDLDLKAMQQKWGRKVSDLSYYDFTQMLNYKALKYGKKVIKIGRFEPSSQICSHCGHRQKLKLSDRTYICQRCGTSIDRDINAAINIRNFALRDIIKNLDTDGTTIGDTDGTSGIKACGDTYIGSDEKSSGELGICEAGKFRYKS